MTLTLDEHMRRNRAKLKGNKDMSDGASKCEFYIEGGGTIGSYLMYNPPAVGDDVTIDDGETYTVIRRNVLVKDNRVSITVRRKDDA